METLLGVERGNFSTLTSRDQYSAYFEQLIRVMELFLKCYKLRKEENFEAKAVKFHLQKLLHTVEALRMKQTYCQSSQRHLWVDLTSSGFPNSEEILSLEMNFLNQKEKLSQMPAASTLKRQLVNELMEKRSDPLDVLCALSKRTLLEMNPEHMLNQFTPGELQLVGESRNERNFNFHWCCYDQRKNLPYINILSFTQDMNEESLSLKGASYENFLEVISTEGKRAPEIGILAMQIDECLNSIHPKILKRLRIGPLYSKILFKENQPDENNAVEAMFRQLFKEYSKEKNDFVLSVKDEVVFSREQVKVKGILGIGSKVREVFSIPETDAEAYAHKASVVHHMLLAPHQIAQHLGEAERFVLHHPVIYTFDERGNVHG